MKIPSFISKTNISSKLTNLKYSAAAMLSTILFGAQQIFAGQDTSWLTGGASNVSFNASSMTDGSGMVNNILKIIIGMVSLSGVVTIAQGYGTWSSGHAEDNSATESKGVKKMIAGLIAALAPIFFMFILGGNKAGS